MFYGDEKHFKSLNGYEINGAWYPRVTQIISIKAKPALYKFYGDVASFEAGKNISAKSAEEGTKMHDAVEKILVGDKPQEIDQEIKPAIQALEGFLSVNCIEVCKEHVERRVVEYKNKYAGTIDALALINGKFGILDIKTSQAIYRDYNLQTSAYMNALLEDPLFQGIQTRWILRIDRIKTCENCGATLREKGGNAKIKLVNSNLDCGHHSWSEPQGIIEFKEFPYWEKDFEAFLAAKRLWEWENEYWLQKIGYF